MSLPAYTRPPQRRMTSLFEGKCGPSVDEEPEPFQNISDDEHFELLKRYEKDLLFRKSIGPNIPLWAEYGHSFALSGLQIDLDFGHFGNVRGICTYNEKPADEFQIEWRHGPDFDEKTSFISKHIINTETIHMT